MAIHDFASQRLYVAQDLSAGATIAVSDGQFNYLVRVLRMTAGDQVLVFNGRDGEWRAEIADVSKRGCVLIVSSETRAQTRGPDIDYLFAPLKRARLDYMVQKAAELGVQRLVPVLTNRTIADRINCDRMSANVIEAAEQCGILWLPQIDVPVKLAMAMATWDPRRTLIFCDETAAVADPIAALAPLRGCPVAVLVGPEGGFDDGERALLCQQSFTRAISLGPRIMRADTAAVAALTLVNATVGDWR